MVVLGCSINSCTCERSPATVPVSRLQYIRVEAAPGQRGENHIFSVCPLSGVKSVTQFKNYRNGNVPIPEVVSVGSIKLHISQAGTIIRNNLQSRGAQS